MAHVHIRLRAIDGGLRLHRTLLTPNGALSASGHRARAARSPHSFASAADCRASDWPSRPGPTVACQLAAPTPILSQHSRSIAELSSAATVPFAPSSLARDASSPIESHSFTFPPSAHPVSTQAGRLTASPSTPPLNPGKGGSQAPSLKPSPKILSQVFGIYCQSAVRELVSVGRSRVPLRVGTTDSDEDIFNHRWTRMDTDSRQAVSLDMIDQVPTDATKSTGSAARFEHRFAVFIRVYSRYPRENI
jgi:hypothetical protein